MENSFENAKVILERLCKDPFVAQQNLIKLTITEIGARLEQIESLLVEQENSIEPLNSESIAFRENFQHFKNTYCEVLFELEQMNSQDIFEMPLEKAQESESAEPIEITAVTSVHHVSELTQEYLSIADYFQSQFQDSQSPINKEQRNKMVAQNLCFAMESECIEKFSKTIRKLWPNRESLLKNILDHENKKFQLHPNIKDTLAKLSEDFPFTSFVNSLRHFLTLTDIQAFKPSLLDTALFILFFGEVREFGKIKTQNEMGCSGLDEAELTELCLKLISIHKAKYGALLIGETLDETQLSTLRQNTERSFELLQKMTL